MLSHVAGERLAAAPSVLITIPETINNWSPALISVICLGVPKHQQMPVSPSSRRYTSASRSSWWWGRRVKKMQKSPAVVGQGGWEQNPRPHPLIFDLTETGGNSPSGWETLWSLWGKDYSSLFFIQGSKYSIQKWKNKKIFFKWALKSPQIILYQWQDPKLSAGGWQGGMRKNFITRWKVSHVSLQPKSALLWAC